jgi:signal transduction histidine kinase
LNVRRSNELLQGALVLLVEDKGIESDIKSAIEDPDPEKHLGLLGMVERAKMAGGHLQIDSEKGIGTTVILRIALNKNQ